MREFSAQIVEEERTGAYTRALTAEVGGVMMQAGGIGRYSRTERDPKLGFPGRWAIETEPQSPDELRSLLASIAAARTANVAKRQGFNGLDRFVLSTISGPMGVELETQAILRKRYGLPSDEVVRHSLACNGMVFGLTEAAMPVHQGAKTAVTAVEILSPWTGHNPTLKGLFGDGFCAAAFTAGEDLTTVVTRTQIDANKSGVLTMPHRRFNTLAPADEREPFIPTSERYGSCTVNAGAGRVFLHHGGLHVPLMPSGNEGMDDAVSDGMATLRYFAIDPVPVIKGTLADFESTGHNLNQLNESGAIHNPSYAILQALIKNLLKQGVTYPTHHWTLGPGARLPANNSSGPTIGAVYMNLISEGKINKDLQLWTGLGVGNIVTSTVFKFGHLEDYPNRKR